MARIRFAYELSDAEERGLIQLIQQGKPLPEKYSFILFEDTREVELAWNGKTRKDRLKLQIEPTMSTGIWGGSRFVTLS